MTEQTNELSELTELASELKQSIDKVEGQLKQLKDKQGEVHSKILKVLELSEIDSVKSHGFLFYTQSNSSVKTPKTLDEKLRLFDFLEAKGIFNEIVSVNSQTLNSLYKNLEAEALENGVLEFRMPGVEAPTVYKQLKMRRA